MAEAPIARAGRHRARVFNAPIGARGYSARRGFQVVRRVVVRRSSSLLRRPPRSPMFARAAARARAARSPARRVSPRVRVRGRAGTRMSVRRPPRLPSRVSRGDPRRVPRGRAAPPPRRRPAPGAGAEDARTDAFVRAVAAYEIPRALHARRVRRRAPRDGVDARRHPRRDVARVRRERPPSPPPIGRSGGVERADDPRRPPRVVRGLRRLRDPPRLPRRGGRARPARVAPRGHLRRVRGRHPRPGVGRRRRAPRPPMAAVLRGRGARARARAYELRSARY